MWDVTRRLEALRGEQRANLLRAVGVAVFYALEVVNYGGLHLGPIQLEPVEGVTAQFHAIATALTVAWVAVCGGVMFALRNRVFPPALPYLTTAADIFLLTSVLLLADGPRSPVLLIFFLVIALAGLRLSERLVAAATVGSVIGYLTLLGDVATRREALEVPAHWQLTTVAALILAGVVGAQVVRAARRASDVYAELSERRRGDAS